MINQPKENPSEEMLKVVEVELAYGKYVHCPTCSQRYQPEDLNPQDPYAQCHMCGSVADLSRYLNPEKAKAA